MLCVVCYVLCVVRRMVFVIFLVSCGVICGVRVCVCCVVCYVMCVMRRTLRGMCYRSLTCTLYVVGDVMYGVLCSVCVARYVVCYMEQGT